GDWLRRYVDVRLLPDVDARLRPDAAVLPPPAADAAARPGAAARAPLRRCGARYSTVRYAACAVDSALPPRQRQRQPVRFSPGSPARTPSAGRHIAGCRAATGPPPHRADNRRTSATRKSTWPGPQ